MWIWTTAVAIAAAAEAAFVLAICRAASSADEAEQSSDRPGQSANGYVDAARGHSAFEAEASQG